MQIYSYSIPKKAFKHNDYNSNLDLAKLKYICLIHHNTQILFHKAHHIRCDLISNRKMSISFLSW